MVKMSYTDEANRILVIEWKTKNRIAKIFTVDRSGLDKDSDEQDAYELIFIDSGGVRRHETLIDVAYNRFTGLTEEVEELLTTCPDKYVVEELKNYCMV